MVDPIARAYAVIGVPRGASTRDLKKQYRRLVRQWHPDRWHHDPVGQAEANSRLRAINDAYETLERLAPREPATPSGKATAKAHRPLTKEELDAIVQAIGTESPVIATMRVLAGIVPIAVGFFMVSSSRNNLGSAPLSTGTLATAAILFVFGFGVLAYHKLRQ